MQALYPNESPGINTLADALPREIARVRVVLGHYKELGPVGSIGAHFIEQDLRAADVAMVSGDVVAMIRVYQTLQGIQ